VGGGDSHAHGRFAPTPGACQASGHERCRATDHLPTRRNPGRPTAMTRKSVRISRCGGGSFRGRFGPTSTSEDSGLVCAPAQIAADSPPTRRTVFDGGHREHSAMAAASANECPAANEMVSAGRPYDAEGPDVRRERHAQPGLCHCRTLGPPPVSESGLTPTFWTVPIIGDKTIFCLQCAGLS
jgi:hypothetical protein